MHLLIIFLFAFRTLSNWVYELDKWAPSIVKISYKVCNYKLEVQALQITRYFSSVFWYDIMANGLGTAVLNMAAIKELPMDL